MKRRMRRRGAGRRGAPPRFQAGIPMAMGETWPCAMERPTVARREITPWQAALGRKLDEERRPCSG